MAALERQELDAVEEAQEAARRLGDGGALDDGAERAACDRPVSGRRGGYASGALVARARIARF